MKAALLVILALAMLIATLIFGYRWDSARNRGHTWGYWGEFNAVSNTLATVSGVTILSPWYNADVTLEEFGFDILVQGRQVKLVFGEKDPIRSLSGRNLQNALSQMVEKQSFNHSMQRMGASRLAYLQVGQFWRMAPTAAAER